jgi:hypothetical protein
MTMEILRDRYGNPCEFHNVNYDGYRFTDFFVRKAPEIGPGFYIYGRNKKKYGTKANGDGFYTMLCVRPHVKARKHPHYNCAIRRGFSRKWIAQEIADSLNKAVAERNETGKIILGV